MPTGASLDVKYISRLESAMIKWFFYRLLWKLVPRLKLEMNPDDAG